MEADDIAVLEKANINGEEVRSILKGFQKRVRFDIKTRSATAHFAF